MTFTAEQVQAAIDALAGGDGAAALEILKALLTEAASGGSAGGGAPPAAAGATAGNAEEPPPEMAALARGVLALYSGLDAASALKAVESLKADADKRARDAAVLEGVERRALVADLVKLGVEVPATAWVDPEKTGAELAPVERLAKEDLAALRKRVSIIRSTRGASPGHTPPAPEADPAGVKPLTKSERAYIERHKITEAEFRSRTKGAVRSARK